MALIGVSITKRTAFRDSTQEFSNVYHYTWGGLNPSNSLGLQIIDAIVAIERPYFADAVSFTYGRLWSAGGSIAENQMIAQKPLTGVGGAAAGSNIDRERALLIQWPAGFDSRGHPVTLKKWFHLCTGTWAGAVADAGIQANLTGFTTAQRATQAGVFDALRTVTVTLIPMNLCAESGRETTGAAAAHKYLEHRQLGDQWRG